MNGNKVTFYSIADLAETLKMAEEWHKANHLPSGEWAEEYASHIFNTEGAEIVIPQADGDGREIMNPNVSEPLFLSYPATLDEKIVG
jgi:hypothetical protein